MRDKTLDDRFYVLTLFAIAFDIEDKGQYEPGVMPVHVLSGLPPAHYGVLQYERFENYFKRGIEEFEFHGKRFIINIYEATAYPQAFAAAMPVYGYISTMPKVMVIDIGGFTADYLLIKNGQADLSVCDTLEHGFFVGCSNVHSAVPHRVAIPVR